MRISFSFSLLNFFKCSPNRHIAWLTALRYQLRQSKPWENMALAHNAQYRDRTFKVPEYQNDPEEQLAKFLPAEELAYILNKSNRAAQIISLQSKELKTLLDEGLIEDFRHMELVKILTDFYRHQGKCERIKNFPYPRQFATLNLLFTWSFIFLVPFGMLNEFGKPGHLFVWFNIPFSTLVMWVFYSMEKVGEASENPFEGGPNDTPMYALSRTIEIDLKEMLDETEIPSPSKPSTKY